MSETAPHKLQLLIRADPGEGRGELADRVRRELVPRLMAERPVGLVLHLTEEPPPRFSVIHYTRSPLALLSIRYRGGWAPERWVECAGGAAAGYRVEESTPLGWTRRWPLGERTPGVGLLTLFRKNPRLSREEFLRQWHGKHTPLSLEVHPLRHYERNVVLSPVVTGSPRLDGIVTEHFRRREELVSPRQLFGGLWWMLPNMLRVGLHVHHFLELKTLECYFVSEVRLLD
ncbi:MAG: EthD domain-containing protein [bacterium]